ncbi:potassium-transporting ATPase subunit F [Acidiferrobacter sp.]|nr:potassium-transporting ATPase subunit F [Acidiferrobacter sp.]
MGSCPVFRVRDPDPRGGQSMIDGLLALVIAVVAYLVYAILYPERF